MLTPSQRTLRARVAGHARAAQAEDPQALTAAARGAFLAGFIHETDPEPVRQFRAEQRRKQHFTLLAFRSSVARSRKG